MTRMQWQEKTFGECAELIRETVSPEQVDPDTPYIGLEHIAEQSLSLVGVGRAAEVSSTKFRFRRGDILFGKLRPYFRKVVRAPFDGICSTDIWVVRPKSEIDPGFLFYWMASKEFIDTSMLGSEGTKMPRAKWEFVSRIKRPIPPLPEQRAIAHILGALDDKIALNRRMNATLEAMARALFKSWFVDFDPVRAKMSGRWKRGESLPGLPAHLYDLFPDRLVPSELDEIPEGWYYSTIGEETKVVGGGTPSTKNPQYWEQGQHFFATPKDMSRLETFILLETERRVTNAGLSKISSGLLPSGTVLLSSRAPVGYLAISQVPVCVNQGIIAMICDGQLSNYYVLLWAKQNMATIKGRASGTTFAEISKKNFRPIPVLVPDKPEIMKTFDAIISPVFERITFNLLQSRALKNLRELLLPKLIMGELALDQASLPILQQNMR